MGYYSEVAIEILKAEEPEFLKMVDEYVTPHHPHTTYVPNEAKELISFATRTEREDYLWSEDYSERETVDVVVYYWNSIKWYYDGAHAIDSFLAKLNHYGFCRVGEEIGDVVEEWEGQLDGTLINVRSYIDIGG